MFPDSFRTELAKFLNMTERLSTCATQAEQDRLQRECGAEGEDEGEGAESSGADESDDSPPPPPPAKKRRVIKTT